MLNKQEMLQIRVIHVLLDLCDNSIKKKKTFVEIVQA
jgi:hypothetical protein